MKHFPFLSPALLLLLVSLQAQPAALSPADCVQLGLSQNPSLLAARATIAEAEARASGAGRLANPELSTELAIGRHANSSALIGLSQRFPFTARLRLERNLSQIEIDLARLEVAQHEQQLAAAFHEAIVEHGAAREALALAERQASEARAFADTQARHVAEGQASSLDAAQSLLAARELDWRLHTPRAALQSASAVLARLLGLSDAEKLPQLAVSLDFPVAPPAPLERGKRAELALAQRSLDAADAGIDLARASRWEDPSVGVFIEREQERTDLGPLDHKTLLGISFSVPLPLRQKGAAQLREKHATRLRLERQLAALEFAAQSELASAYQRVLQRHAAAQAIEAELLPLARQHVSEAEALHAKGEAEPAVIFRARERLAALEQQTLDARKSYHLAVVQWRAASGQLHPVSL